MTLQNILFMFRVQFLNSYEYWIVLFRFVFCSIIVLVLWFLMFLYKRADFVIGH